MNVVKAVDLLSPLMQYTGLLRIKVPVFDPPRGDDVCFVLYPCWMHIRTQKDVIKLRLPAPQLLLARTHRVTNMTNVYRRYFAAVTIQQHWKRAICDPSHALCRRRLVREFGALGV